MSTESGEKDGFKGAVFHSVSYGTCNVDGARKTCTYFQFESRVSISNRSISNLVEDLRCVVLVKFQS